MFSYHNRIKLEINKRKIFGKIPKYSQIKNHTSKWSMSQTKENSQKKEKLENVLYWMNMKAQPTKFVGYSDSNIQGEGLAFKATLETIRISINRRDKQIVEYHLATKRTI